MVTKLGKWSLNAEKWRKENGYTTPEWEMYVNNSNRMNLIVALLGFILGYTGTIT